MKRHDCESVRIVRRRILLGTVMVASLGLISIGSAARAEDAKFAKKSPLTLGYSIQSAQDPYWKGYVRGIEEEMKKYGFTKLLTQDSQASAQKQVSGSLALVNNGISALIISPHEPSALPATITAAHNEKIPVIVGDVGASGDHDGFVLSDNYQGGVLAADFIMKALASKPGVQEVAAIALNPTTSVNKPRSDGFTETIAKNPNFKVVANISGLQTLEGGFKAAQAILAANPKVAAIYSMNDSMAAGAQQAIEQAGRNSLTDPILVGFNGDEVALKLMAEGKLAADVAQSPYQQGKVAVDLAWSLLNGEKPTYTDAATKTVNVPVELVVPSSLKEYQDRTQPK
jgi:ribose transport system substrate-binding protein